MKVAIDARLVTYQRGGIGQYILHLIEEFARLPASGAGDQFIVLRSRKERVRLARGMPEATLWTPPHNRFEQIALPLELMRLRFFRLMRGTSQG